MTLVEHAANRRFTGSKIIPSLSKCSLLYFENPIFESMLVDSSPYSVKVESLPI